MSRRVIVTGGGTGGHVYPALTLAQALRREGSEVLYVGTARGLEARVVPAAGIPFATVISRPFHRTRPWSIVGTVMAAGGGLGQAFRLLRQFRPDLVIATGGYVCGPVGLAAAVRHVPLLLQEQNAVPGRTSRYLARYARYVALGFEEAISYFPAAWRDRLVVTGNPVRPEIRAARREEGLRFFRLDGRCRTLLVAGGSQGAQRINRAVQEALPWFLARPDLQVIWATGERAYGEVAQALRAEAQRSSKGPWGAGAVEEERVPTATGEQRFTRAGNLLVAPFLEAMPLALAAADLAVSRAGALSLAELLVQAVPAILVPYPFAADDHQSRNAEVLAKRGAARLVTDGELSGERLAREIQSLLDQPGTLERMKEAAAGMARPRATEAILELAHRMAARS